RKSAKRGVALARNCRCCSGLMSDWGPRFLLGGRCTSASGLLFSTPARTAHLNAVTSAARKLCLVVDDHSGFREYPSAIVGVSSDAWSLPYRRLNRVKKSVYPESVLPVTRPAAS